MNQDSRPATNSPVALINVFEVPTEHVDARSLRNGASS